MDRNIKDYLPEFMQEYKEFQKIMDALQFEVEAMWNGADDVYADQFIYDSSADGVARWERMLQIIPKATDTLDQRKFRIISKLNFELPYTLERLNMILENLCGEGGYSITLQENDYFIQIKLKLENKSFFDDVVDLMKNIIPANLITDIVVMYNTHEILANYPHYILNQLTHDEIRTEVITDLISNTCGNLANYKCSELQGIYIGHLSNFGMRKVG